MQRVMKAILSKTDILRYGMGLLLAAVLLLFAWPGLFGNLFAKGYGDELFQPHYHCYLMLSQLVWLHLSSDLLIGLSYVAISFTLAYLVYRARRDIPFHWVFLAFGLFIIACGCTHFMEVWTMWNATYWLSGYVKLVTAAASVATAVVLPPLVPRTLALVQSAKVSEERRIKLEAAHAELESLYGRMTEMDELKTRFFANVSHELRTPLALILGPVERLLTSDHLEEDQRRAVEAINRNARSLLKQVNDLLDVSKLEAGRMGLKYAEVDLARLLRLTASHFGSLALERNINLSVETPPTLRAEADAEKLQRVLLNLLANAFKFTPERGMVACELEACDGRARIRVADSGPGVPAELRDAIFDRFRQGEGSSRRHFGSTGLGLSIAKEFIELHGGTISVDDGPEGGARFIIELPLEAPEDVLVHETAAPPALDEELTERTLQELQAAHEGEKRGSADSLAGVDDERRAEGRSSPDEGADAGAPLVLVVEDNPEMNRFIVETLAGDYRTVSALDGEEGLEKADELRPDLVISDLMMPRMGGDRFVRELRKRRELDNVPVLLLSAKVDDELRVRLLREGAQDYLVKPFSIEELRVRVGNQVRVKRLREMLQGELASQSQDLEELAEELASRRRELQASEQRYRSLADAMPQIVWTARADGWIDYYNQRWFEYTGLTLGQTQGWGWQPVLHPDDIEPCLRAWARSVQTGDSYQIEYRFRRASDRSYRWHLGRALPMRDEHGQIIRWFGTCTDIDDQKRLVEERNALLSREQTARRKAEEASRAKDDFLATLSHELRTPLTPIIGWVHMIRADNLNQDDLTRGLAVIDKNSQSLTRLINDLLDMSAILSGKMRIERVPLPLQSVIDEAVETIRPYAGKQGVELQAKAADCAGANVNGDRTRLVQVFWNLLHNAVKFSQDGGLVRIECELRESDVLVHVSDEGRGITADFLPHVFERFRQADSSMTRAHGGLGIGLALVKSFVEAHGGDVSVVSEGEGRGSRFTVRLPRLLPALMVTPLALSRSESQPGERAARVLVIEDAPDTLEMLRTILEMQGYHATLCESGAEALRVAAGSSFDLIVSDIGMPGISGLELIARLREMRHLSDVPAVALTGHAMRKDADSALAAGFDAHIAKPIDPSALASELAKLLRRTGPAADAVDGA